MFSLYDFFSNSLPSSIGPLRSRGMSSIQRDLSIPMQRNKLYNHVNDVSMQEIQENNARSATTPDEYESKPNVNMNIGESDTYLAEHNMNKSITNRSCADESKVILLEESGRFIVLSESKSNGDNIEMHGQKYNHHLKVEERHVGAAQSSLDNAYESSNIYEGKSKQNSQLSSNIENQLKRSNDTNDQHIAPMIKHDTREESELDESVDYYRGLYASETQSLTGDDIHSMSDSEYCNSRHARTKATKKSKGTRISRGLQVGTFLSANEINQESSGDSLTGSDNDLNNPKRTCKKRPATMGKSHQSETVTKRKSNRRKGVQNHDVVNTKFPAAHRSMTDISLDRVELSEGWF